MLLLTVALSIAVVFLLQWLVGIYKKKNKIWQSLEGMPQPPSYPIIGNLLDLLKPTDQIFKNERGWSLKYFPIYKLQIFSTSVVSLVNPEDIELLVTNMKHNTKSELYDYLHLWLGTGLLTSTGAKWQNRRKILTPAFHFNILQEFANIFYEDGKKLIADLKSQCQKPFIDVTEPITKFTLDSIAETAMGISLDESHAKMNYKESIYKIGKTLIHRSTRPWLHNDAIYYNTTFSGKGEKKLVGRLHDFTTNIIEERKKNFNSYSGRKRMAMLDLLLSYREKGADIDDEGIREEVDTFMFEGHDTTAVALCYILMVVANHPEIQKEIYQEMMDVIADLDKQPTFSELQELKYMERCIKEVLRLYPSVPFISRVTGEELTTATGYTIPKDCVVNIEIYDMHHNPNLYPDPEKFDPDRFLPENSEGRHKFAYLPFSAGPRNCIGQKYAMLEMKMTLCSVLKEFVLEAVDTPKDMVFVADLVLRTNHPIRVKFIPRA